MGLSYGGWLVGRAHYNDLLREAERERLIRLATSSRTPGHGRRREMAGMIGVLITRWGRVFRRFRAVSPPVHCGGRSASAPNPGSEAWFGRRFRNSRTGQDALVCARLNWEVGHDPCG